MFCLWLRVTWRYIREFTMKTSHIDVLFVAETWVAETKTWVAEIKTEAI